MGGLVNFDELVDLGVYEHMDVNGELMYTVNMPKAKQHAPEIYYAELDAIDTAILEAIEAGYLELDFAIEPEGDMFTSYVVTKKGSMV